MRIYTRKGDDGTTGLLFGGRVPKHSPRIELNGAIDEAQAALGLARAEAQPGSELDELLVALERQLYVVMADVATETKNRTKLVPGTSLVTSAMVGWLEERIDRLAERFPMPTEFVVPGANRRAAALDVARTVARRAERVLVAGADAGAGTDPGSGEGAAEPASFVGPYLNRLSDLLWVMARWQEGEAHLSARSGAAPGKTAGEDHQGPALEPDDRGDH